MFCCQLNAQSSWSKYVPEGAFHIEEANNSGFWLYYTGDSLEDNSRVKLDAKGDFEFREFFKLDVPKFYFEFEPGRIRRRDTIDGNIIWEQSHGFGNAAMNVTNSGLVILTYNSPNLSSGQGYIKIFDKDGNLKFEKVYAGPLLKNSVNYSGDNFDGSVYISWGSTNGWAPQGSQRWEGGTILFDQNGDQVCEEIHDGGDTWVTRTYCSKLIVNRSGRCSGIYHQLAGDNTNDQSGTIYPCEGLVDRSNYLLPTSSISTGTHMIHLSAGGYAILDKNVLRRSYCGWYNGWDVEGTVYEDTNNNCILDLGDEPIGNLEFEIDSTIITTSDQGRFSTTVKGSSTFQYPYSFGQEVLSKWVPCQANRNFDVRCDDISNFNILLVKKEDIAEKLTIDAGSSNISNCENAKIHLSYCNYGLAEIGFTVLKLPVPKHSEFLYSNPSPDSFSNDFLYFSFDSLEIEDCGQVDLTIEMSCDSVPFKEIDLQVYAENQNFLDTTLVNLPIFNQILDFQLSSIVPEITSSADFDVEISQPIIYQVDFKNSTNDSIKINGFQIIGKENLDMDNLKIISSSHSFFQNSNTLSADFYLTPIAEKSENSEGFIRFSIPPNTRKNLNYPIILSLYTEALGRTNFDTLLVGPNIINESFRDTIICENDFLYFDSIQFDYVNSLNAHLINYSITTKPNFIDTINLFACYPEVIDTLGQRFEKTEIREVVMTAENGCDSIIVIDVEIQGSIVPFTELRLCAGDTVTFNGIGYTIANQLQNIQVTFESSTGCDSIIGYALLFFREDFEPFVFETDTFPISVGGIEVFGDTLWQELYENNFGCDSIISYQVIDLNNPSSVKFTQFKDFNIFPNPTKDQLTLDFESIQSGNFNFKITNIYGRQEIIKSEEIHLGENSLSFNTAKLQSGVFFISIENPRTGATKFVSKFIKI